MKNAQRIEGRKKAIELLQSGMHPLDIAGFHVPFEVTAIYRIARDEGIAYKRRTAGRHVSKVPSQNLRTAYKAVQKGKSIEYAAVVYRVNVSQLRAYAESRNTRPVNLKPVESSEFEALRAYYRRHAANLTWFQSSQF